MTVAAARAVALEWAALYKSGVRDLRQHFANVAAEEVRVTAIAQQRAAAEAQAADLNRQRRLTIRQVFERWAASELAPHIVATANDRAEGRREVRAREIRAARLSRPG